MWNLKFHSRKTKNIVNTFLHKKIKYCTFSNFVLAAGALSCLLNGSFDMELHITSTMVAFGLMCSWSLVNFKEARHEIR